MSFAYTATGTALTTDQVASILTTGAETVAADGWTDWMVTTYAETNDAHGWASETIAKSWLSTQKGLVQRALSMVAQVTEEAGEGVITLAIAVRLLLFNERLPPSTQSTQPNLLDASIGQPVLRLLAYKRAVDKGHAKGAQIGPRPKQLFAEAFAEELVRLGLARSHAWHITMSRFITIARPEIEFLAVMMGVATDDNSYTEEELSSEDVEISLVLCAILCAASSAHAASGASWSSIEMALLAQRKLESIRTACAYHEAAPGGGGFRAVADRTRHVLDSRSGSHMVPSGQRKNGGPGHAIDLAYACTVQHVVDAAVADIEGGAHPLHLDQQKLRSYVLAAALSTVSTITPPIWLTAVALASWVSLPQSLLWRVDETSHMSPANSNIRNVLPKLIKAHLASAGIGGRLYERLREVYPALLRVPSIGLMPYMPLVPEIRAELVVLGFDGSQYLYDIEAVQGACATVVAAMHARATMQRTMTMAQRNALLIERAREPAVGAICVLVHAYLIHIAAEHERCIHLTFKPSSELPGGNSSEAARAALMAYGLHFTAQEVHRLACSVSELIKTSATLYLLNRSLPGAPSDGEVMHAAVLECIPECPPEVFVTENRSGGRFNQDSSSECDALLSDLLPDVNNILQRAGESAPTVEKYLLRGSAMIRAHCTELNRPPPSYAHIIVWINENDDGTLEKVRARTDSTEERTDAVIQRVIELQAESKATNVPVADLDSNTLPFADVAAYRKRTPLRVSNIPTWDIDRVSSLEIARDVIVRNLREAVATTWMQHAMTDGLTAATTTTTTTEVIVQVHRAAVQVFDDDGNFSHILTLDRSIESTPTGLVATDEGAPILTIAHGLEILGQAGRALTSEAGTPALVVTEEFSGPTVHFDAIDPYHTCVTRTLLDHILRGIDFDGLHITLQQFDRFKALELVADLLRGTRTIERIAITHSGTTRLFSTGGTSTHATEHVVLGEVDWPDMAAINRVLAPDRNYIEELKEFPAVQVTAMKQWHTSRAGRSIPVVSARLASLGVRAGDKRKTVASKLIVEMMEGMRD